MSDGESTLVLGDEYDDNLKDSLLEVLQELEATESEHERAVAGSQDVETAVVEIAGERLTIVSETYEGLSITGPKNLVTDIAARVKARRS